eukprot:TRINITY_DN5286_c0_g3_i1.p1 TRINITY_DN5286_c0_g3~~TRINITY_DN5286_c0_g3_i1.p1  ORF type:complete len:324 (+),score=86.36 TRINITY_DN5286_c0_g3_i1:198-1169(+)
MSSTSQKIIPYLCFFFLFFTLCFSWGHLGHSAIAEVAYSLLNEDAKLAVQNYISPFSLAGVAPQPDEYAFTTKGGWSEPLHFLNLARNATGYTNASCPDPPSCVVRAILNYTNILIKEGRNGPFCISEYSPYVYEPCSLIFLTHFVGDIHQPLHCGYGDDEGGNLVPIYYYSLKTELHQIWDTNMIENYTMSNLDINKLAEGIKRTMLLFPDMVHYYYNNMNVISWANESFDYVRNTCYVFTPNDAEMKKNSFNSSPFKNSFQINPLSGKDKNVIPQLGTWYLEKNLPIIFQRLTAASIRLAHLLNDVFGTNPVSVLSKLDPK